jgi:hypothetical protein
VEKARNDLSAAVPKFCLALEEHRRTPDGRVRTSQELLTTFFPHDEKVCTDRILKYLPMEVRGPIIAAWGIRGIKSALRDNDEKAQTVLYDALLAGDVDHVAFEDGLTAETLVRWVPLGDLWTFWRGGKLTKQAIHKALATAYELFLFDARWFLETISARGGALKGTDVLADGLTKDDLTHWVRRIHETGDGSPKGVVAALGWDKIVAKTPNEVLVSALDAVATKVGLVAAPPRESSPKLIEASAKPEAKAEPAPAAAEPPAAGPARPAAPSFSSIFSKPGTGAAPEAVKAEAKPAEAKPVDAKAPEARGSDAKLADAKAVEAKPAEAKPAEAKSGDAKPAQAAAIPAQSVAAAMAKELGVIVEEPSWSEPPPAETEVILSHTADDLIVVVDDDAVASSAPPMGAPAKPAVPISTTYEEDEQTIIKPFSRSQPPPARGGSKR